ncbi:MFS transporter [Allobranchiibius sp. GilTou38]|uniref:MFS transporter n=1 Tax=Allobranchiibius sp. GilTou38 TaxID=2815210 RepID=UPI001AA186C1|nr:MFS transporter [Allobranchiibius sp. GilTou38]MBO1767250.1 MFS transporter [Allobranchiibius sp. GilTou38]
MRLLARNPWMRVALMLFAVGWGANQFAPLLLVYEAHQHLTEQVTSAMFAAYVIGLMPALLLSARLAGHFGHRAIIRPVMLLAMVSSGVLLLGHWSEAALFVGRVLYGVATGAAMAPGTTWVKELSADSAPGTGARRAAMSLSAGFMGGPLVSGLVAQWLPAPEILAYAVHIVLMAGVTVLAWTTPQTGSTTDAGDHREHPTRGRHTALSRAFWAGIAPAAPWVFTCASISLVVLPDVVRGSVSSWEVAFSGIMAGLTLGTGVLIQQPARGFEARRPGVTTLAGMGCAIAGSLLALLVAQVSGWALVPVAGIVLGAGYGLVLVGGLTAVERLAPPHQLAMTNAVFYCLTYVGFFMPTVIATLVKHFPTTEVLGLVVVLAVLTTAWVALRGRRDALSEAGAASTTAP